MLLNHGVVQNEPGTNAVIMNNISLKVGINKWGKKVIGEVHSEMKNIHMMDTFINIYMKDLNAEQRNTMLEYKLSSKIRDMGP